MGSYRGTLKFYGTSKALVRRAFLIGSKNNLHIIANGL
jgi:hypothetical protein